MKEQMLVMVGSYAEANDSGVYVYGFDEESGQLSRLWQEAGLKNPTFLSWDPDKRLLYAIAEGEVTEDGRKTGDLVCYRLNPVTGELQLINRAASSPGTTCHVVRDKENRYCIVASYHHGSISLVSLQEDGSIGELMDTQQHVGQRVDSTESPKVPHPHSALFSPDGRYLFVADLGLDLIRTYTIDTVNHKLVPQGDTLLHSGAGPRHMVFHPNGGYLYVINELDSTITGFHYDSQHGELHPFETVSTLPVDYDGENGCAEIALSEDGRYLYGSNRGHDSIVVYRVDEATGALKVKQHISTEGGHPRHFALTPGGRYLLAANRDANNITVFTVHQETGLLAYTGHSVSVSKPVCVLPRCV